MIFMRLSALSNRAVSMAARLPYSDVNRIARWLYRYGTLPRTSAIERDFGVDDEPMSVLGLSRGGRARRQLAEIYEGATYPGWHSFSVSAGAPTDPLRFKLYVSPRPDVLASAFPIIAESFCRLEVKSFKVGRGLDGLLRPDKLVAYFESPGHLHLVAAELAQALSGCPAQGVPFTASCAGASATAPTTTDGLLSQGIDPPPDADGASWRAWITRRLAQLLVNARPTTGEPAAQAALAAAEAQGIDVRHWVANEALFTRVSA
jgi:hypothetical protein